MMRAIRLLPFAFLFLGAVTLVDRGLNDELMRLSSIRNSFTMAVSDAKGRLSAVAWNAISDSQIQQNFEMGNINTVSQSLQGYVRPGEVSQLDVIDADCNLLARVPQSGRPISELCQAVKSGKPALIWQQNEQNEAVLISIVSRSIAGRVIFVASQLVFDQAWLSLHPDLASRVFHRDVGIGAATAGALLWKEGLMADGRYALPIVVDGWIYRVVPELTGLSLVPLRESFWVLYGALGIMIMLSIIQIAAKDRNDALERAVLEDWVREHQAIKTLTESKSESATASWSEIVNQAKTIIASKDEQRTQQMRLLKERVESVTKRLRERDLEIAELESKLVSMSDLASLQEQLQHTTASFLRQMNQMREVCENIYDVASSGLAVQAKALNAFCSRWKDGLKQGSNREMAARKFFRSLVETRGQVPGSSKLDEDMRELDNLTASTLDQSLNAAMLARQAVDDCEAASKLAALWHGIAMRDQTEKTSDWAACLISAQRLVGADDRFHAMSFEVLPQLGNPDEMYPAVTSAALVSGFFHLYLALLIDSDVASINLPMVVRQKRFKGQATIILSLPSKQAGKIPESPSRQMLYHVDLSKQILSACGLKVSILPPTIAGYPVGVTWSLPQKDVTIVTQKSDAEVLHQS